MKHIIVLFVLILGISYGLIDSYNKKTEFQRVLNQSKQELLLQKNENNFPEKSYKKLHIIPKSFAQEKPSDEVRNIQKNLTDLNVDFYPQSPYGKWGPIFNDTCEEASALLALNYVNGESMSREDFRDELLGMVDWQNKVFGDYKHTDVNQTAQILQDYFGFKDFEIVENPSLENIKATVNNGNIIIAPFYGIDMNPNYLGRGPEYHFMVIKGYTDDKLIIHDVGTKQGENYLYDQDEAFNRIHDYDSISVKNGKKRYIVLKKQS